MDETARFWFVEFASPPQAKGGIRANIASERQVFWTAANEAKLRYTKRFVFERLWNGVSIEIDPARLDTLKLIDGIKAIYPVATIEAPDPGVRVGQAVGSERLEIRPADRLSLAKRPVEPKTKLSLEHFVLSSEFHFAVYFRFDWYISYIPHFQKTVLENYLFHKK